MKYIASWSGGKDSTAMIDLLLRDKKPLDYIVFMDTGLEFKSMYEYINKIKAYWEERYNANIVFLKPRIKTYEQYILKPISRGDNKGKLKGFLSPSYSFCELRRDNKINTFEKWVKSIGSHYVYIGFTVEEEKRVKRDTNQIYPLFDDYKMSEKDCFTYLRTMEMENPLYRYFKRTGCRLCPYQSKQDWYKIWKYYPEIWAELKEYENMLKNKDTMNLFPFIKMQSTDDYENIFKDIKDIDNIDDEPLKDCLCKI